MKTRESIRKERMVEVGKSLYKKYQQWRQACRGIHGTYAKGQADELHRKIFYSDYRPSPHEETVEIPHPLLMG